MVSQKETKEIKNVIDKNRSDLASTFRVRQTGVGYKIRNNKITDEVGVVVYVSKKEEESKLRSMNVKPIPKEIEGIVTDVQTVRYFPRIPDDNRYRPIEGGIATIRSPSEFVGTLGMIVKNGNKYYGITNNHVGANEDVFGAPATAQVGDPWVQPSNGLVNTDLIARLSEWNRLKSGPGVTNYYDFAMGETNPQWSESKVNEIMEIGKIEGTEDSQLGDIVMKRGRTTGKTTGRVIAVGVTAYVRYQGLYDCPFDDQVNIVGHPDPNVPFSQGGDSGSVVVSGQPSEVTGKYSAKDLLFAGGPNEETGFDFTIASPIRRIVNDYNLTI